MAMAFDIVLDAPHSHTWRRLARTAGSLSGYPFILCGLVGSVVAVFSWLFVAFSLAETATGENPRAGLPDDFPSALTMFVVALVATAVAVGGTRRGLRMVRGTRNLVLFLRRFGYDQASTAVAYAVVTTIGTSWRLVTLDDDEIAPVGVAPKATVWVDLGTFAARAARSIYYVNLGSFLGMLAILGLEVDRAAGVSRSLDPKEFGPVLGSYLRIVGEVVDFKFGPIEADLHGAFRVLAVVIFSSAVGGMAVLGAIPVLLLFLPVFMFFTSAADAAREAEQRKPHVIYTGGDAERVALTVWSKSRKILARRMEVVRSTPQAWRKAVLAFASYSSITLVDISEPTGNLLWELEELTTRASSRCVLVGHRDKLEQLAALASDDPSLEPWQRRLSSLLDGHSVLGYTTDRKGLRRFARALRSTFIGLEGSR